MVEQGGFKTRCFWKNGLGGRHGDRCEDRNDSKYLWYDFFPSFIYLELFCFALILKCGGSHILGLGGSTVKARCALLHLVNPDCMQMV